MSRMYLPNLNYELIVEKKNVKLVKPMVRILIPLTKCFNLHGTANGKYK